LRKYYLNLRKLEERFVRATHWEATQPLDRQTGRAAACGHGKTPQNSSMPPTVGTVRLLTNRSVSRSGRLSFLTSVKKLGSYSEVDGFRVEIEYRALITIYVTGENSAGAP